MADLDITTIPAAVIAVTTSESDITLSPQRVYDVLNMGSADVYASTDGAAVVADTSQSANKLYLGSALGTRCVRISGLATLKMATAADSSTVIITCVGHL